MTMQRYFLDGFGSEESYQAMTQESVFPLIRELEFKHGLKVLGKDRNNVYQLCYPSGVAVGTAWVKEASTEDGGNVYNFRTPYYKKARGSSPADKETIHSNKISSLMAVLKREGVVRSKEKLENGIVTRVSEAISIMKRGLGDSQKQQSFTAEEVHAILARVLGEHRENLSIDLNKCKNIFDIYENADKLREFKQDEIKRVFMNPFYLAGVDGYGHYLIGKFKLIQNNSEPSKFSYETVEPLKRYKSIEDYPDLVPLHTMIKLAYENTNHTKHNFIPRTDAYDAGLDTTFFYQTNPSNYDCLWMVTPC